MLIENRVISIYYYNQIQNWQSIMEQHVVMQFIYIVHKYKTKLLIYSAVKNGKTILIYRNT